MNEKDQKGTIFLTQSITTVLQQRIRLRRQLPQTTGEQKKRFRYQFAALLCLLLVHHTSG